MNKQLQQELLNCPIGELGGEEAASGNNAGNGDEVNYPIPSRPLHVDSNRGAFEMMHLASILPSSSQDLPPPTRTASFMEQVLRILDDAEVYNFEHVVSWQPDGVSFKVHQIREFETSILPRYLEQTKVRSFQRQLIRHGFHRIQGGSNRGSYLHPKFTKADRASCLSIEKLKRSKSEDSAAEPGKTPTVTLDDMSHHFQQAVQESRPAWLTSRDQKKAKGIQPPTAGLAFEMAVGRLPQLGSAGQAARAALELGGPVPSGDLHFARKPSFANNLFMPEKPSSPSVSTPMPMDGLNTLASSSSLGKWQSDLQSSFTLESPSEKVISSRFLPSTLPGQGSNFFGAFDLDLDLPSPARIDSSPGISKPSYFLGLGRVGSPGQKDHLMGGASGPTIDFPSLLDDDSSDDDNIWKI